MSTPARDNALAKYDTIFMCRYTSLLVPTTSLPQSQHPVIHGKLAHFSVHDTVVIMFYVSTMYVLGSRLCSGPRITYHHHPPTPPVIVVIMGK